MTSNEVKLGRLHQCTFEQTLELRNRGFEKYHRDMQTTMASMLNGFGSNGIHPELSVVAYCDDKPVGFVFIAIKTILGKKLAWNGGTGVFPEYRGRGIAKSMMNEAQRVLTEEGVDRAILEVNHRNSHAIAAYQSGGFEIVDQLIGMTRTEALEAPFYQGDLPDGLRIHYGKASDIRDLPFHREKSAWGCMWHSGGESLIVYDSHDQPLAYSLFTRSFDERDGRLTSASIRQCEVSPSCPEREKLFRILFSEVYGAFDKPCSRRTGNLSMSNPEAIELLKQAGFATDFQAFLMIMDKKE